MDRKHLYSLAPRCHATALRRRSRCRLKKDIPCLLSLFRTQCCHEDEWKRRHHPIFQWRSKGKWGPEHGDIISHLTQRTNILSPQRPIKMDR
ncbi:hypothetical protein AVEN_198845-1 [Araneus ventricosus]|uniref:Uncharacterized protein n=1 Tax=Araneus ventricosus TaxID=182803 RepID=A0A4Y2JFE6_ARAVE|nr:hypothetical protein AVEN_198845-1 [Araneus ventricosus]